MADAALKLVIFYGISSPWAYFGAPRAVDVARTHGAEIVLRPIRIIEANGGIPLRSRPDARQRYHAVELDRWRRYLDMPLNLTPKFYPCATIEPAAQLVIAAQEAGLDAISLSFAIQRALWSEDRDIADLDTLRAIAQAVVGSQGPGLVRNPQPDDIVTEWQGNLAEAERLGIFGTPTYVVNGELFWGQDRLEFASRALGALKQQLSETAARKSA
ncbi:2-hydroxychromene-2-carboxylate isomerase [Rhizobium pusense]|jgi:2-hydroxychromene-2-carboxylate isomerase|uniref:2-hydroxychromene-2-carboxylate isomerase n=1 Tax=Agrobacterium pusense TaxID=648995 RepID=UPI001ACA04B3|nr:2-hydroxychromene-2-carboxylate isomerase [Agrobacterium pusense]MBN8932582.1 2-hydroxychromene-2-carboxylate isomerase [Agrobacterium pusense]MBW9080488.1 2-hydroxychromene-2-carboxylate isomerase [Agrobacterium pusense]